ncbi:hypothetical protein AB0L71_07205 [Streptomyces sp. NPDC052052]|uniref:hypothetical protein n=1 Tax=Streptomyces sp. NPDC052052 TaxID=3154756 RepID=UPI00341D72C1
MNTGTPKKPTTPTAPAAVEAEENPAKDVADGPGTGEADTEREQVAAGGDVEESDPTDLDAEDSDLTDSDAEDSGRRPSGLASAAAAVAAAGLGVVALTGSWTGKVAAERETLIGQIKTSSSSSAAQQISEIYGDAWHATALVNGLFALLALLVGIFALVRPAFGPPSPDPQPGWVRAVASAGIALGVLGVLLSVGMYFDLIVALPTTSG